MSSGTKVANQEQQARSATRPQRPAPPGPLKPTRARRRPALIALGLALVALSVLASLYVTTSQGATHQALAVNKEITRGTKVTAADITVVDLPNGPTLLESIPAEQLEQVADVKFAAADLKKGQLLTPDSVVTDLAPPSGQSIVGIALTPSQMPTSQLHAGDSVRVVETPATGGEPPVEAPFAIAATVIGVSGDAALGDQTVVDVQVASGNAAALAARAATGRVAIVIDAVGAG
ncbi:SAF domain-containing protein [Promicromonospora sp. NPDC060204]|uniref:SAF domain-containing protein n=1 Tax=Promicromonospora sp. NPDC060204 TaxID=3347071 RepID=UPI00365BC511